jgi:predicted DNA binding CopG/RHH family protein
VEKPMNTPKIPPTDSIEELARFWDTHDLTDFEDELEEVTEPIFERTAMVKIHLQPKEMEALKEIAQTRGLGSEDLIRQWILEKIGNS